MRRVILLSALALAVGASPASAALSLKTATEHIKGGEATALSIEDTSGIDDRVELLSGGTYNRSVSYPSPGEVEVPSSDILVSDDAGVANVPTGCERVDAAGVACPRSLFDALVLKTGGGDDSVGAVIDSPNLSLRQIRSGKALFYVNVFLGPGRDKYGGGRGSDFVNGGPGRDLVFGAQGNDVIAGRGGADNLQGAEGRDLLLGGAGNDKLATGGRGHGFLIGGPGRDLCIGKQGDRIGSCEVVHVSAF